MAIQYESDNQGIVTLTIDMPDRSVNVLNEEFNAAYADVLEKLQADKTVTGVILTSAKRHFVTGADIDATFTADDPAHYFAIAEGLKAQFRQLETLGKPVVAALNGSALGGGLELALACHYRIALADERIQFGFPEVGLGVLPGAGGVTRTVRLLGLEQALEWLTQNKKYTPQQALAAGMIHELAADVNEMMQKAKAWIVANPDAQAPWDSVKKYRIPGGGPDHPKIAQQLAVAPAMLRKETRGNYPAPPAILAAMVEGAQVDFATACRIESRYFAHLAAGQTSKNLISAFWTQRNQIQKGESRPPEIPPQPTQKVGVLGAGMMGHGIAYVTALAGIEVVMTDADQTKADTGKARIAALMAKRVQRGRMDQRQMDAVLARVTATDNYNQLTGCDLIVEAVFEDRIVKAEATRKAESVMDPTGIFASNTSTLPITSLANASVRPDRFIGMHFFSPVDRMQLVELIVGKETSAETLAKAFDFVQTIRKVPIVVNDSRGFYTSRVFGTWTNEGMAILAEGQHPHAIEMAALQAGMAVGPLAVMDEISLTLADHVRKQALADSDNAGKIPVAHPAYAVLDTMLAAGRSGRAGGGGFYDYGDGGKVLWPGLAALFPQTQELLPQQEMIDRILFTQSIETVRCLEEGVLRSVADANLGAIFGWGYPACHGGPLQFINAVGVGKFVKRAHMLATTYGERFAPPQLLIRMAAAGTAF